MKKNYDSFDEKRKLFFKKCWHFEVNRPDHSDFFLLILASEVGREIYWEPMAFWSHTTRLPGLNYEYK